MGYQWNPEGQGNSDIHKYPNMKEKEQESWALMSPNYQPCMLGPSSDSVTFKKSTCMHTNKNICDINKIATHNIYKCSTAHKSTEKMNPPQVVSSGCIARPEACDGQVDECAIAGVGPLRTPLVMESAVGPLDHSSRHNGTMLARSLNPLASSERNRGNVNVFFEKHRDTRRSWEGITKDTIYMTQRNEYLED